VSFVSEFNALPLPALVKRSLATSVATARESLTSPSLTLADFAQLISPAAGELLEQMGRGESSRLLAALVRSPIPLEGHEAALVNTAWRTSVDKLEPSKATALKAALTMKAPNVARAKLRRVMPTSPIKTVWLAEGAYSASGY